MASLSDFQDMECCVCGSNLKMVEEPHKKFRVVCMNHSCGAQGGLGSSMQGAFLFAECIIVPLETEEIDIDGLYPENIECGVLVSTTCIVRPTSKKGAAPCPKECTKNAEKKMAG